MSQFASKDDLLAAQAARIAELESQLEAIGAGGVEPLRKQAAAPQEEAIAEIVSASHDQAEFGERAINFLRDFQHLEYGTKLYPAAQAVQPAVPDGWQMVPAKPTEAMVGAIMSEGEVDAAAGLAPELRPILLERAGIAARYTAMLAAAPAHPAEAVPAQCPNINEPRGCWRVACQLGGKCREPERSAAQPAAQVMDAQQYRLIQRGELIEAGDQFLRDDFTWQIDPRGIFVGVQYGAALRPARRALAAQAKQGGAA